MRLFNELKRRNVFRVAVFYVVFAWLIVQIAETVLPVFDVPDVFVRGVIVVLAIGFVPALVFAWAFELTPDGLKRDKNARVDAATKQRTAQKLNWATLTVALLAIGLLSADYLLTPERNERGDRPVASAEIDRSIAVLPFVNMSTNAENEFFADGISEELLNILAGIEGLHVASRTSAFAFKGQPLPIPEIADALGVRHILEGSVRRQGDRVRITAQLIDAKTDAHLWSDTYERELTDIFRVQESIARAITDELTTMLGNAQVTVDAPTEDLQAYDRFLRGRSLFYRRDALDDAIQDLTWAVERDPQFAEAWGYLAAVQHVLGDGGYSTELDRTMLLQRSLQSADRALALDSEINIAKAVKGNQATDFSDTFAAGINMLESASQKAGADTSPQLWYAMGLLELGYAEQALEVLTNAQQRDPLVPINLGYLGVTQTILGNRDEGQQRAMRAIELNGDLTYWALMQLIEPARAGNTAEALELIDRIQATRSRQDRELLPQPFLKWLSQSLEEGLDAEIFEARYNSGSLNSFETLIYSLLLGDDEQAIAIGAENPGSLRTLTFMMAWFPAMESLRENPNLFQIAQLGGHLAYWEKHGYPFDCRRVTDGDLERLECGGEE